MTKAAYIPLLAALVLGAACDVDINPDENAAATTNGAAEAQDGRVSIKAPGVDISVAMPEDIKVNAESDSDLLYPGSTLSGVNIDGSGDGAVAIRFTNAKPVDKVTAWYRDAARTGFVIDSATNEGGATLLNGHDTGDNSPFTLRLSPASGGGTEGTLSIRDSN